MTTDVRGRAITVRQLEDRTYQALKERAKRNSRSMEAEARQILTEAVLPTPRTLADLAALLPDVDEMPYVRPAETFAARGTW